MTKQKGGMFLNIVRDALVPLSLFVAHKYTKRKVNRKNKTYRRKSRKYRY